MASNWTIGYCTGVEDSVSKDQGLFEPFSEQGQLRGVWYSWESWEERGHQTQKSRGQGPGTSRSRSISQHPAAWVGAMWPLPLAATDQEEIKAFLNHHFRASNPLLPLNVGDYNVKR